MRTYTSYQKDFATFSGNGSVTAASTNSYDNITWGMRMINDSIRQLATVFYFNEVPYTVPGGTVANQQGYTLPGDFESLMNCVVTVGGVKYIPKESPNRIHFDSLNVVPFYNDFTQFYYIYNGEILLWPTPATDANQIVLNYKKRINDLSMDDVTQTTASTTISTIANDQTVTAAGAAFKNWMAQSGWLRIPNSTTDAANGDNKWYQIGSVTNSTNLELKNIYSGTSVTAGAFTIGDVPILPEDYQDIPLYKALRLYYSTRVPDPARAAEFKALHDESYALLDNKYGSKSTSPVLTDENAPVYNPNLFPRNLTSI